MESLFNAFESDDISVVCIAMETIGYIAITPEGKHTLHKQGNYMVKAMLKMMEVITKSTIECRIRALNTLTNLIKLEVSKFIIIITLSVKISFYSPE